MRRATAWFVVVVGVALLGTASPARAADGFWVSIAAGFAGNASTTGYQEWWFETPHGPPPVAVTRLSSGTAEATTGGGTSFFSGGAVPVVLKTTDGYAYISGGPKPSDLSNALTRQTSGGQGLASATPEALAPSIPADAVLLTADFSDPNLLTVAVTDQSLAPIGSGTIAIPEGGWYVIGLGPGQNEVVPPLPDPLPPPPPPLPPPPPPVLGPVATPEPATGMLLGVGGMTVAGWRWVKRRRTY